MELLFICLDDFDSCFKPVMLNIGNDIGWPV